jgi:hypothetical protein
VVDDMIASNFVLINPPLHIIVTSLSDTFAAHKRTGLIPKTAKESARLSHLENEERIYRT